MKKIFTLILIAALVMCFSAFCEETPVPEFRGKEMPDFTIETIDGGMFTLSEALKEKKAVIISFWASWCKPCEDEFGAIQKAYEQYMPDAAVIAISLEPNDTPEVLSEYALAHGLTFCLANGTENGFKELFSISGIPVNLAVDRFGNIAFFERGSATNDAAFFLLLETLCADNYTKTRIINGYPESTFATRKDSRTCTEF